MKVHLVDRAAIAPPPQGSLGPGRKVDPAQPKNLTRGEVEDKGIGAGQAAHIGDVGAGVDAGVVGAEEGNEGIGKRLRTAFHHWPAAGHAERTEEQAECGGKSPGRRGNGVYRATGE